jgi:hypothetical protein
MALRYIKLQNAEICIEAVRNNGNALEFVDKQFLSKTIQWIALKSSLSSYIFIDDLSDSMINFLIKNKKNFHDFPASYRFCKYAVMHNNVHGLIKSDNQTFWLCKTLCCQNIDGLNYINSIFDFIIFDEYEECCDDYRFIDNYEIDYDSVDESFFYSGYPETNRSMYERITEYEPSYDDEGVYDLLSYDERSDNEFQTYSEKDDEGYRNIDDDIDYERSSNFMYNRESEFVYAILINLSNKIETYISISRGDIEDEIFKFIINASFNNNIFDIKFSHIIPNNFQSCLDISESLLNSRDDVNCKDYDFDLCKQIFIFDEKACLYFCKQIPILTKYCITNSEYFIISLALSNFKTVNYFTKKFHTFNIYKIACESDIKALAHIQDQYDFLSEISELSENFKF